MTPNAYTEDQLVEQIENALDEGLPRAYSKELYEAKCSAVFEHVYQSYQGEGQSVYAAR
ncbi:MAG: hypothetical protein PHY62_07515 [Gallionella sp.]|nr:hypothetical protein [Gallionella sp.]